MTKLKAPKLKVSKAYKIKVTPTFKLSLSRQISFLSHKYSAKKARANKYFLYEKIKKELTAKPNIAPVSQRLLGLGIANYRQWSVDKHNIIFYRINNDSADVTLLLAMDARQDIQKLLYELMLLD